jgi:hypothetical protein
MIKIPQVEAHFALPGRSNFDEPAAMGEAVEGAPEHDAADQIKDHIRAFVIGCRVNLGRQILRTDDQLLGDSMDRRVRVRRASVSADDARAKVRATWAAAPPTPPPAPISSTVSPAFSPAASMPLHAAM